MIDQRRKHLVSGSSCLPAGPSQNRNLSRSALVCSRSLSTSAKPAVMLHMCGRRP